MLAYEIIQSAPRPGSLTITRKGWCPRTDKGERLIGMKAANEYTLLATHQGKISQ